MVAVNSTMLPLGTGAPAFSLPDPKGEVHSLADFAGAPALVVAFICNHCPYVRHIADRLAEVAARLEASGAAFVGIQSNDVASYPDDSPARMAEEAELRGYTFPYLYDETQEVARAYRAACTPDFYVFDGDRLLVYRGQFDDSRPGSKIPVTGDDLVSAVEATLRGELPSGGQTASIGCSIKWKPGAEPEYAP